MFFTFEITAQSYFFKEYNEEDGLPSGTVFDIAQDSLGRMWFATRNGIVSYDASRWNYFNDKKVFNQLSFVRLALDGNGTIWTINQSDINELYFFKNEEWSKYNLPQSVKGKYQVINNLKVDVNGNDTLIAFCGNKNEISIFNKGLWQLYSLKEINEKDVNIFSLLVLSDKLLVCTSNGIVSFDRNTSKLTYSYEKKLGLNFFPYSIERISNSDTNFIAFGNGNLVQIKNGKVIPLADNLQKFSNNYSDRFFLVPNYLGKIFFGNSSLIFEYNILKQKIRTVDINSKIKEVGPLSFFIDYEQNLWISGKRGLLKMQTTFINTFNEKSGLLTDEVTSVIERNNKYYFSHENGLTIYDGKNFKTIEFKKSYNFFEERVLDLCLDSEENIWIAIPSLGFGKLNKSDKIEKWYNADFKKSENAHSLVLLKNGSLIAATSQNIYEFDGNNFVLKHEISKDFQATIRKIFTNETGDIVVATMGNGIIVIGKNGNTKQYKSNLNKNSNYTFAYFNDDKISYVGTMNGLFFISGDSLKQMENRFKVSRPIYFITKDLNNNFWIGTDNGVFITQPNGYFHLSTRIGLLGYETNRDAGYIDSKGTMWVGTAKGVSSFESDFLINYQKTSPKIITLIQENGKYIPLNKEIKRDHDFSNIELYVSTVSFINEYNNKINYKLDNVRSEEITIYPKENPFISVQNLESGSYHFEASSLNPFQKRSDLTIFSNITISTPYYEKWWFYISSIILFMPFIYITIRYFERKRQAKYLEEEVEKRSSQLSESENKYKNLLNRIQDAVFVIQDSKMIFINEAFLNLIGYEYDEVINQNFGKFIAPEDLHIVKDRYEKRLRHELVPAEYEFRLLHKNGFSRVYVNMHVGTFDYEGKVTTIGTLKDVTAVKMAQEKIVKSEARLRALTNTLPDTMFELDENGILIDYHLPENSPILIHPLKLIGKNIAEFLPRSLQRFAKLLITRALVSGKIQLKEFFLVRNNKKLFYEARVIVSSEKKVLFILRDISERKESEQQLIEAKEQAEQSDKLKSEFLAQVSHEIRTPINTILNFASLIKEDCEEKVDPDLKDSFNVIENGGRRLIRTIDLILNMSQIQTDAYQPNFTTINLDNEILSSIYSELKSFAESKNIKLNYEIENSMKLIEGDSYTLGQIFMNLVDNAIKYTLEGEINIKSSSDENYIFVEVSDTGIGISKEFLPSVFSPFSQEETGYTRKFEGTGLGLALVKNYVSLNKGEITVESQKGVGTKFIVKFSKA